MAQSAIGGNNHGQQFIRTQQVDSSSAPSISTIWGSENTRHANGVA
jgi:hypothetical protein